MLSTIHFNDLQIKANEINDIWSDDFLSAETEPGELAVPKFFP